MSYYKVRLGFIGYLGNKVDDIITVNASDRREAKKMAIHKVKMKHQTTIHQRNITSVSKL